MSGATGTIGRTVGAGIWLGVLLLSASFGLYAMYQVATGFQHEGQLQLNKFPSPVPLEIHIVCAGLGLLLGPWQFVPQIRARNPRIHRWIGRTYVLVCTIGAVTGGTIALFTFAGPFAGWGFLGLAIAWGIATLTAFGMVLRRNFVAHEAWMIRSFALTLAAVTFRTYLEFGRPLFPNDFVAFYGLDTWVCWIPNLIVAELFIATLRRPKARSAPAGAVGA